MKKEDKKLNVTNAEKEIIRSLKENYGLKYLHEEEVFYKLFKISRQDFLNKLEKDPKKAEKIIL